MPVITPPPFTNTFTGSPIYPSQISGLEFTLTGDTPFAWPFAIGNSLNPLAAIMDMYTDVSDPNKLPPEGGWQMIMPPANQASPYQSAFIRNLGSTSSGGTAYPIQIVDNAGGAIVTIPAPVSGDNQKCTAVYLYLTDNSTPAGKWQFIWMGIGTSSVEAASLAGAGLKALNSKLNENMPISIILTDKEPPYGITSDDRAKLLVWTGAGTQNLVLPEISTVGNGFIFSISNQSKGSVINLTPAAGQLINDQPGLAVSYGDSLTVVSYYPDQGQNPNQMGWYTISGQASNNSIFYSSISIDLANQPSPYTEPASIANAQLQIFQGKDLSSSPFRILFPSGRSYEYLVQNNTDKTLNFNVVGGDVSKDVYILAGVSASLFVDGSQVYIASQASSVMSIIGSTNIAVSPESGIGEVTISFKDTLAIDHGGTGASTKTAAFDALSPMTTAGDLVVGGTGGSGTRLPKGTANQVLAMNSDASAIIWSNSQGGGTVTETSVALGTNAAATSYGTALGASAQATGDYSTALGVGAMSSNNSSIALGRSTRAQNINSTALGYVANASGENSTALGKGATAEGKNSIAIGNSANVSMEGSIAIGNIAEASGYNSTALGVSAISSGLESIALGRNAQSLGGYSMALGRSALVSVDALYSIAIGYEATTNYSNSTALGYNAKAMSANTISLGGNAGTANGYPNVGIGNSNPQASLHISPTRTSGNATLLLDKSTSASPPTPPTGNLGALIYTDGTDLYCYIGTERYKFTLVLAP